MLKLFVISGFFSHHVHYFEVFKFLYYSLCSDFLSLAEFWDFAESQDPLCAHTHNLHVPTSWAVRAPPHTELCMKVELLLLSSLARTDTKLSCVCAENTTRPCRCERRQLVKPKIHTRHERMQHFVHKVYVGVLFCTYHRIIHWKAQVSSWARSRKSNFIFELTREDEWWLFDVSLT